MKTVVKWLRDEEKRNIIFTVISAAALILSLTGVLKTVLPWDPAWIAICLSGIPILIGCIRALIVEHNIKADMLVSIALVGSVYIGEYFAAGEVAFIMAIGTLLEDFTSRKAYKGIEALIKLSPKTARVKRDGCFVMIPAEEVMAGDTLQVLAGETVAVDGTIIRGSTAIDQSVMTGESIPVDKTAGDDVTSGTVNQFGTFEMTAVQVGKDSSLQRMIRLASAADANKAPIVSQADRWATWLVAAALSIAALTWVFSGQLVCGVTVLVVFCPCAFILATPTAVMAGIGNAARAGILVRSGDALQRFSKIQYAAFDKTGTLTLGKPEITGVESFDWKISEEEVLRLTAGAEQKSEHPLGRAIYACYREKGKNPPNVTDFKLVPGMGVSANVENRHILAGKSAYMKREKVVIPAEAADRAGAYFDRGATVIYVSADEKLIGLIALADVVRAAAGDMIEQLKGLEIEPVLLTGDNEAAAGHIAAETGIKNIKFNMLPEEKMRVIREFADKGKRVCMIGDGINDALALKTAYAGIAMGGIGSDIAVEASDAVLVSDNIERIPCLFKMAERCMKRINFNITAAMLWNVLAVILSVLGVLNPITAALVHNAGSVFVVISSALLITEKSE